jgi:N-methylhydantoinase A/oxoprolinase/acetone carboxylase beta subunit
MIGIDTGGTYTDGVLLEYPSRRVLASSKSLTTRDDLTQGITAALEGLNLEDPSKIKLVCISSTLATNSIAEGKGRRVGLILIGYDKELIVSYNLESKFPTPFFEYFRGGHTVQGEEKEPLDHESIRAWIKGNESHVDALAISSYFSPLNTTHEEQAFKAVREISSLPGVLGHQLSTKIDSIKRATTACLNASLVAIMQEFIQAVRESLKVHGIEAPLMIVKGDGSLMPYPVAVQKPVETILSGPAASAIGGRFLSEYPDALIIDIGGTTTDIAVIENSQISIAEEGARVGEIETAVKAARIRTIGLGGDSRISFSPDGRVTVGPVRVVPLSYLAAKFERAEMEILRLKQKPLFDWRQTDLEYWFLHKNTTGEKTTLTVTSHRDLVELLSQGPLTLTRILEEMDFYHPLQLNAESLIRQGLIEQSTLTPTDLLHVNGQFMAWSTEAAKAALEVACTIFEKRKETFIGEVLDLMTATIVEEVVVFLGHRKNRTLPEKMDGKWGKWFLEHALIGKSPYLDVTIASRIPIIGIGAPAGVFLKKVAEVLHTPLFLPPYAHVANAVGAVAGSVMVVKEALIYRHETEKVQSFFVQTEGERSEFEDSESAVTYAKEAVENKAREAALESGAIDPQVIVDVSREGGASRVVAKALGNPRLSW